MKPMSPCNIQYDVIIKQEYLDTELGYLFDKVNLTPGFHEQNTSDRFDLNGS